MFVGGDHFQHVATHPKGSPVKINVVSFVLHIDKPGHHTVHACPLSCFHRDDEARVVFRRSKSVNAGYGSDNDDVTPRQQRMGGGVSQLVDIVIDGRILFNVCI